MRDDDMARCKRSAKLLNGLHQGVIIRNKNLEIIAHFRQLRGRTDEVWNRTRSSVPNEDLKSFLAQIGGHATTDNPEADDSNIFSHWTGHVMLGLRWTRHLATIKLRAKAPAGNAEVCEFPQYLRSAR